MKCGQADDTPVNKNVSIQKQKHKETDYEIS